MSITKYCTALDFSISAFIPFPFGLVIGSSLFQYPKIRSTIPKPSASAAQHITHYLSACSEISENAMQSVTRQPDIYKIRNYPLCPARQIRRASEAAYMFFIGQSCLSGGQESIDRPHRTCLAKSISTLWLFPTFQHSISTMNRTVSYQSCSPHSETKWYNNLCWLTKHEQSVLNCVRGIYADWELPPGSITPREGEGSPFQNIALRFLLDL